MASRSWEVVACLLVLRTEFNLVSPKRDKGADGTIGDDNHASTSDHTPDEISSALKNKDADNINEVHGLDIDSTGPWPDGKRGDIKGSWFDRTIHAIIAEERRRWLDPKDMCRLRYIIWMGRIYSQSNDFLGEVYHGDDPHTNHAHFSARYETRAESDTRPWGVYKEDDFMTISQADFNKLMDGWAGTANGKKLIGEAVATLNVGSTAVPTRDLRAAIKDLENQLRPALTFPASHKENTTSGLPADAPLRQLLALPANVRSLTALLSAVSTKVETIATKVDKFTSA